MVIQYNTFISDRTVIYQEAIRKKMESVALDAQAQDKLSGVTKETKNVKVGLRPGVSPQLIIQEVGRQLEGWRGKYHKEVGGILLDHGKITVEKVVSIPQDSWTAVPVLAVIEGIFYVIKMSSSRISL